MASVVKYLRPALWALLVWVSVPVWAQTEGQSDLDIDVDLTAYAREDLSFTVAFRVGNEKYKFYASHLLSSREQSRGNGDTSLGFKWLLPIQSDSFDVGLVFGQGYSSYWGSYSDVFDGIRNVANRERLELASPPVIDVFNHLSAFVEYGNLTADLNLLSHAGDSGSTGLAGQVSYANDRFAAGIGFQQRDAAHTSSSLQATHTQAWFSYNLGDSGTRLYGAYKVRDNPRYRLAADRIRVQSASTVTRIGGSGGLLSVQPAADADAGPKELLAQIASYTGVDRRPDLSVHTGVMQIAIDTESACQGAPAGANLPDYCQPDASPLCLAWNVNFLEAVDCDTNKPTFTDSVDVVTGLDSRQWWIRDGNKLKHVRTGRCLSVVEATGLIVLETCTNLGLDLSLDGNRIGFVGKGKVLSVSYTGSTAEITAPESSAAQGTALAAKVVDLYTPRFPAVLLRRQGDSPLHLEIFDQVQDLSPALNDPHYRYSDSMANVVELSRNENGMLDYRTSISGLTCTGATALEAEAPTGYAASFGQIDCGGGSARQQIWQAFRIASASEAGGCALDQHSCDYLIFKRARQTPLSRKSEACWRAQRPSC